VINASNQTVASSSLPILSLADYTTSRGVPTATALANQAKITPKKHENILEDNDDDDDASMSTDEYNQARQYSNVTIKTGRGKKPKGKATLKTKKSQPTESIQYGPILVKPRKRIAPTLSSGRRSKDDPVRINEILKNHTQVFHSLSLASTGRRCKT
jgi:hypothetical protein